MSTEVINPGSETEEYMRKLSEFQDGLREYQFEGGISIGSVTEDVSVRTVMNREISNFDPHAPVVLMIGGGFTAPEGMLPIMRELSLIEGRLNIVGVPHTSNPNVTTRIKGAKSRLYKAAQDELREVPNASPDNSVAARVIYGVLSNPNNEGIKLIEQTDGPLVIVGQSNGCLVGLDLIAFRFKDLESRKAVEEANLEKVGEDSERIIIQSRIDALNKELSRQVKFVGFNPAGTFDETPGMEEVPIGYETLHQKSRRIMRNALIKAAGLALPRVIHVAYNFTANASRVERPYSDINEYKFFTKPKVRTDDDKDNPPLSILAMLRTTALDSLSSKIRVINELYNGYTRCCFELDFGEADTVFQSRYFNYSADNLCLDTVPGKHEASLVREFAPKFAAKIMGAINK